MLGLQSTGSTGYSSFRCNYSYGMYNGSLKLWDLYWADDRTPDEFQLGSITDVRRTADRRMYDAKALYYKNHGKDRRRAG